MDVIGRHTQNAGDWIATLNAVATSPGGRQNKTTLRIETTGQGPATLRMYIAQLALDGELRAAHLEYDVHRAHCVLYNHLSRMETQSFCDSRTFGTETPARGAWLCGTIQYGRTIRWDPITREASLTVVSTTALPGVRCTVTVSVVCGADEIGTLIDEVRAEARWPVGLPWDILAPEGALATRPGTSEGDHEFPWTFVNGEEGVRRVRLTLAGEQNTGGGAPLPGGGQNTARRRAMWHRDLWSDPGMTAEPWWAEHHRYEANVTWGLDGHRGMTPVVVVGSSARFARRMRRTICRGLRPERRKLPQAVRRHLRPERHALRQLAFDGSRLRFGEWISADADTLLGFEGARLLGGSQCLVVRLRVTDP